MIELKNLTCRFENKTVLQNISLQIPQHLSILGANGSGKSTLARSLCGLVSCEGDIFLNGKNIKDFTLKEKAQTIAYIPAKLETYDANISVHEFVLLGRFAYKRNFFEYEHKDKSMVERTLNFLHIPHLKHNLLHELSSGEQQLVLIAQALMQESGIIIFDEPTANLDPKNSKAIARHIKELKKNHTVILITHDLHLANYINSPVGFIKAHTMYYFENDFFNDKKLEELYGVAFHALAVQYD